MGGSYDAMVNDSTPQKTVGATERTLRIITALKQLEGARISELSECLDMSKSSIHSHLATLEKHKYVIKRGDIYQLGLKFLTISEHVRNRNPVFRAAKPRVKELAQESGEVASLMAEDHGKGIFVYRRKGTTSSRPTIVGNQVYLHTTAGGKAILAYLPAERTTEIIDRLGLPKKTENTITDRDDLLEELENVRDRGVAFNYEEDIEGLRAVAAPVMGSDNHVVGALSIYGPAHRMQGGLFEEKLPDLLLGCANDIQLDVAFTERRDVNL